MSLTSAIKGIEAKIELKQLEKKRKAELEALVKERDELKAQLAEAKAALLAEFVEVRSSRIARLEQTVEFLQNAIITWASSTVERSARMEQGE